MDPEAFGVFSAIFSYILIMVTIIYFIRVCRQRQIIEEQINEPLIIYVPTNNQRINTELNNGSINNQSNSYQQSNITNKNYTIVDDPSI
jgi:hypothetical protein